MLQLDSKVKCHSDFMPFTEDWGTYIYCWNHLTLATSTYAQTNGQMDGGTQNSSQNERRKKFKRLKILSGIMNDDPRSHRKLTVVFYSIRLILYHLMTSSSSISITIDCHRLQRDWQWLRPVLQFNWKAVPLSHLGVL